MAQRQAMKEARLRPNRALAKQYCVSHTTVGKGKLEIFLTKCLKFFPFQIRFILTDNGKEFMVQDKRNRFGKIEKKNLLEAICFIAVIDYRKTKVKHP